MNVLDVELLDLILRRMGPFLGLCTLVCKKWRRVVHGIPHKTMNAPERTMAVFAATGNQNLLCWAKTYDFPWDPDSCTAAAQAGHLPILQWLRQQTPPCPWTMNTCVSAARGGHLHILKWIRRQQYLKFPVEVCNAAAKKGHFEIVQWLGEERRLWDASTCAAAAYGGHGTIINYIKNRGCRWDARTCACAALTGRFTLLKSLREHHCPWNVDTCKNAVFCGHLPMLQWAVEQGCPVTATVYWVAVMTGRLEYLQWLERQHISEDWKKTVCKHAAVHQQIHVLKWAIGIGCPVTPPVYTYTIRRGDVETLKWLDEKNLAMAWKETICEEAANANRVNVLRWAVEQGCPTHPSVYALLIERGDVETLEWLSIWDSATDWKEDACEEAAKAGHLPVLQWAIEQGCPVKRSLGNFAAIYNHTHILEWILTHRDTLYAQKS